MDLIEKINSRLPNDKPLPSVGLLLVGTNPLPVYAVIKVLKPTKVILLGTADVSRYMKKLNEVLKKEGIEEIDIYTTQSAEACQIRATIAKDILKQGCPQCWFSYTGGTKAMAVHAYEEWKKITKHCEWGVYLAPAGPTLHFAGKAGDFQLAEDSVPQAKLATIADLHLFQPMKVTGSKEIGENTFENKTYREAADAIHKYVMKASIHCYLDLLPPCHVIYKNKMQCIGGLELVVAGGELSFLHEKNFKDSDKATTPDSIVGWDMKCYNEKFGQKFNVFDDLIQSVYRDFSSLTKHRDRMKTRLDILKWLATKWLECWVANTLYESKLFHEVVEGTVFLIPKFNDSTQEVTYDKNLDTELDVCVMRGLTPYVFSCTVDSNHFSKAKLFEVRQRATQIGGEHARSAVVCLAPQDGVKKIKAQMNQGWDGYGTIEVFGVPQLKDENTFLDSVKKWINTLEQNRTIV